MCEVLSTHHFLFSQDDELFFALADSMITTFKLSGLLSLQSIESYPAMTRALKDIFDFANNIVLTATGGTNELT